MDDMYPTVGDWANSTAQDAKSKVEKLEEKVKVLEELVIDLDYKLRMLIRRLG